MKIGILSNQLNAYPTQRILVECENLDIEALFLKTSLIRLILRKDFKNGFDVNYLGHSLSDLNVVIPRIGSSMKTLGEIILCHFEAMQIPITSSSTAIHIAKDKFRLFQKLKRFDIPIPETTLFNTYLQPFDLINIRNLPVVIKPRNMFHGLGCIKIKDLTQLLETTEAIMSYSTEKSRSIMIQEFIDSKDRNEYNSPYQDYRLFVIDNEVIASMTRIATFPEWRTNVARNAYITKYNPKDSEKDLAIKSTQISGLRIAGVDLLHDKDGKPLILEINACPGFKGIEEATGVNIAKKIVEFALKIARK